MKSLSTIAALLFISLCGSQTILTINQSPGSLEDGFSIGLGLEKQEKLLYYGAEAYAFPQLNGIDYGHLIGRIGLAVSLEKTKTLKIISGVRVGLIYRGESINYANLGAEAGLQVRLSNFYFIIAGSVDNRTDSKYYSNVDYITVKSVWLKIGVQI